MKLSVNEVLMSIPLYQLTFLTPFPKEEIYYKKIVKSIPHIKEDEPTLLIIETKEDWLEFNNEKTANQLIQNANLQAVVIDNKMRNLVEDDVLTLYLQCQIPIIQVENKKMIAYFLQESKNTFSYSKLSLELGGFYKRGFINIAKNLSMAFDTPLIFLDENKKLLQHTGTDKDLDSFFTWFNELSSEKNEKQNKTVSNKKDSFEQFLINPGGQINMFLFASTKLVLWQKNIIDKFIGFTAVLFQTEEAVKKQNEEFKEFFIYELLCRKFQSKTSLLKQGKTWGLNLENPHHLLMVDIESSSFESIGDPYLLNEIMIHLEAQKSQNNEKLIILPFQKHIIVLIEDQKGHISNKKDNPVIKTSEWVEEEVSKAFPNYITQIGIGKWYSDTIDLNKSYQGAKMAIQFGKVWFENTRVYYMHDLGVLHLLFNINSDLLHQFCEENLTQIIKSDQKQSTEYLKTLKAYFQYNGVIKDVSEVLFIHPNTLRIRLNKIEQLIGIDRQNLEQLLTLMIAVKIYYSFYGSID